MYSKYVSIALAGLIVSGCGGGGGSNNRYPASSSSSNSSAAVDEATNSSESTTKVLKVVDGYIKNAKVLIDINTKTVGKYDYGDIRTTTDENGQVIIDKSVKLPKNVIIYATGGINTSTNQPFKGTLTTVYGGDKNFLATPLTTMVTTKFKSSGDLSGANEQVAKALNIDSKNLAKDPVKDKEALKATQKVVAVANLLNSNNITDAINKIAKNIDSRSNIVDAVEKIDASKAEIAKKTIETVEKVIDSLGDLDSSVTEKYINEHIIEPSVDAIEKNENVEDILMQARNVDSALVEAENCLSFDLIKGSNSSTEITKPLNLDAKSVCEKDGVVISWLNSKDLEPNNYSDKKVSLEAKIEKNSMSIIKKFDLTIKAKASAPVAKDDSVQLNEDNTAIIDVLANDKDADGFNDSKIEITVAPSYGYASLSGNKIIYKPKRNFYGNDSLVYKIVDKYGATSSAKVSITVVSVNDAPNLSDDSVVVDEDSQVTISVLANDSDIDSTLSLKSVSSPAHGKARKEGNRVVYRPNKNFSGDDSFTYQATDGIVTKQATVRVTVKPINDAPIANDDSVNLEEGKSIIIDVLSNDSDPDGDSIRLKSVEAAQNGVASLENGKIKYTPNSNFTGVDSFKYTITDGDKDAQATVSVRVSKVNHAPVAKDDSVEVYEDRAVLIDVLSNDSDADGDRLRVKSASGAQNGILAIENGKIKYTPNSNFNGTDSFEYILTDGTVDAKARVFVTIKPVNDAPVAQNIKAQTNKGSAIEIELKGEDLDGDSLSYAISKNPAHGSASVSGNILTYTPNSSFVGSDVIEYQVSDGELSSSAKVTIEVINTKESVGNSDYKVINLGSGDIDETIHIDSTNSKSVYLLFTNTNANSKRVNVSTSVDSRSQEVVAAIEESLKRKLSEDDGVPAYITEFNNKNIPDRYDIDNRVLKESVSEPLKEESEGDRKVFYTSMDDSQSVDVTLKKVVSNVETNYGLKTLKVWVANNTFGSNCKKSKCLTQEMVDEMADSFLKKGLDNDIYDWVTNIFGEAWGETNSRDLIADKDEIDILLLDIYEDNRYNGGTTGFFWSKDNYKKSVMSGSNERVMFYIDSVIYANRGENGDNTFWKTRMFSTLAHEFQHMINYYQRNIKLRVRSETWLNEMLSVATQDALATKIGEGGVRNIDPNDGSAGDANNINGRFPDFNANNDKSLTEWTGKVSYSLVASFSSFLTRNYNGVAVLRDIQHDSSNKAIQNVVNGVNKNSNKKKDFANLLQEWGVGVILSDRDDLPDSMPRFNFGGFLFDDFNNITYELGSINFFNYNPAPKFHTTSGTINENANYYYKVGENLSGDVNIKISIPKNVTATLIAK